MQNVRIMFLRNTSNHPVGCIAMSVSGDKVTYQVSTLNPVDRFNRRVARQLAIGRMVEKPISLRIARNNIHEVVRVIMQHISLNEEVPARSRKAAKDWLKVTPIGNSDLGVEYTSL